ncbi:hypothetical protein K438DRAFT_1753376 [Mycena galopus ATCC 62051]|nr:hypothetical protein K438DRAFT_1753376 [Mycena galopus ATCC 62051]
MSAVPSTLEKPTKKRSRKTEGKRPGKTSWVHGTKLVFLSARADDWKTAQELGPQKVSEFYDDVSNLFLQKYGYYMKDEDDLAEDVPDPTDPNAPDPDAQTIDKEEADRRTKISRERIGQWYRLQYGGGVEQGKKNLLQDLLAGGQDAGGGSKPGKQQPWQFYSKLFYEERVKARFEAKWKVEVQRAKDLDLAPPHDVKVRGEVTREAWEGESPTFRADVMAQLDADHAQRLQVWEMGRTKLPKTKEELISVLNNAGHYLQPLADAIQEKFQMSVAIMLAGPVGDHGGAVGVRSVHSGRTKGLNPRSWYEYDRVGYRDAEKSMIRFAEKCYSTEECRSRVVGERAGEPSQSSTPMPMPMPTAQPAITRGDKEPQQHAAESPAPAATNGAAARPAHNADGVKSGAGNTLPPRNGENGGGDVTDVPPPQNGELGEHGENGERGSSGMLPPHNSNDTVVPSPNSDSGENHGGNGECARENAPMPEEQDNGLEPEIEASGAWERADMAQWSEELRRAHAAFSLGKKWGADWGHLVIAYLEFEAACGYQEAGPRMDGEHRPAEVAAWMKSGRKWGALPKMRKIGSVGDKASYADDWWLWWRSVQPPERECMGGTLLTWPTKMTWGKLPRMYGKNGFMLVIASLLWWGQEETRTGNAAATGSDWGMAVTGVTGILKHLVREGLARVPDETTAVTGRKRKQKDAVAPEEEVGPTKKRKTRGADGSGVKSRVAARLMTVQVREIAPSREQLTNGRGLRNELNRCVQAEIYVYIVGEALVKEMRRWDLSRLEMTCRVQNTAPLYPKITTVRTAHSVIDAGDDTRYPCCSAEQPFGVNSKGFKRHPEFLVRVGIVPGTNVQPKSLSGY